MHQDLHRLGEEREEDPEVPERIVRSEMGVDRHVAL